LQNVTHGTLYQLYQPWKKFTVLTPILTNRYNCIIRWWNSINGTIAQMTEAPVGGSEGQSPPEAETFLLLDIQWKLQSCLHF